jgi:hypothetical protein
VVRLRGGGALSLIVATALVVLLLMAPSMAAADIGGNATQPGTRLKVLTRADLEKLAVDLVTPRPKGPWYRYATTSACPGAQPGVAGSDNLCTAAVLLCAGNTEQQGLGPAVFVFRREVDRSGAPVPGAAGVWDRWRYTCLPQLVPGAGPKLSMSLIRQAFHDTDFAVPTVNIQPEGDVTLVNLPTFFEVQFPAAGFGPNEVDTPDPARLLGYHIEVRPRLKSITYHLGATTIGPTTSLGGPHPSGDIRATYTRPGAHQVRADIVYTGQFRVGGSQWFDIPGDVDLQGTPVTLTVREATSRLYTH